MSTVTDIGEAIRKLPPQEAWKLAADLREYLDSLWDTQFEEDVKAGRLDDLIARLCGPQLSFTSAAGD
ncbi:MAG TPA: hypothetical protein VEQ38_22615 [Verrucomicrobiae bacterium]|nr:hypothetical protein [Verrucomicrobiae bacterium]